MGEGDLRGDIRRIIFTKVRDNSISVMNEAKAINKNLSEFSKRYKDFDQLEKLNIELTVPIQLPPNGKNGDCKAVVLEVQKSFNEHGGGSRIYHALGSWLDDEKKVVSDHCVVVYAAMPINKWYECIPVLQRLIRDEIQSKLFQECVFLRIDNQTFGDPLNLLGKQTEDFPSIDEFEGIDPACEMIVGEYERHPVQTVMHQEIKGDKNIQISSRTIRDVNITHGIDAGDLAKFALELIEQHNIKNQANKTSIVDKKVVVLTGAGISKESGISTFEDDNGLWKGFLTSELKTKAMWDSDREVVWEYYQKRRIQLLETMPNPAHFALQELSKKIKDFTLITQNVDDLHERAGSSDVLHVHGSLRKWRCEKTGKSEVKFERIHFDDQLLYCGCCHEPSVLRPDIVWYGEQIQCSHEIYSALYDCDIFNVVGTSGRVSPAASFVDQARKNGAKTILVNLRPPKNIERFHEIHLGNASTLLPELVKKWT